MHNYLAAFSVYTLAMVGLIFVGLVVVKKTLTFTPSKNNNNFLKIETSLPIEPRKTLHVVKAGKERFLIASSGDNCHFMTKLENRGEETPRVQNIPATDNNEIIQEYFTNGRLN